MFLLEAVLVGKGVADLPAFVPCHGGFAQRTSCTVGIAGLLMVEVVTPLIIGIVGCRRFESELFVELDGSCKVAYPLLLPCLRIHIFSLGYRVDSVGVEVGFRLCSRIIHKVSQVMLAHIEASDWSVGYEVGKLAAAGTDTCLGGAGIVERAVEHQPFGHILTDFHTGIVFLVTAVGEDTVLIEV